MRYILVLFAFLISYGSLYPFHFSGNLLSFDQFIAWFFNLSYQTSRADIVANILLFLPFGFVSVMTLSTSRRVIYHTTLLFFAGTFLAYLLQYLQFYLPARVPSSADALYNSIGIIVGILIAHIIKQYSQQHLTDDYSRMMSWSEVTIPVVLALLWVAWRLFPFVPQFTTNSVLESVSPLLEQPELNLILILRDLIGWLVFFYLLTQPPFDRLPRFRILKIIFYLFALEILIRNNSITVNDLLSALGAFAIFTSLSATQLHKGLTRGLVIAILISMITPLDIAEPENSYLWLPFSGLMKGNPWANGEILLLKIYLFAALIYMLKKEWFDWFGSAVSTVTLLLLISVLQIFFGDKAGDFTDPLLGGLIAWALSQIERVASDERAMAIN